MALSREMCQAERDMALECCCSSELAVAADWLSLLAYAQTISVVTCSRQLWSASANFSVYYDIVDHTQV